MENKVHGLMGLSIDKIKEMVDVNTVIGEPMVLSDGMTLIPVSRVSYGFASGGSDFGGKTQPADKNFGGGAGAGVNVTPIAFLVVKDGIVKLISVTPPASGTTARVVEMVPDMFDKVTAYLDKKNENKTEF